MEGQHVSKIVWKDVSSFSRNDTERTSKTFEIRLNNFVLIVTRHIHYPADAWVGRCHELSFQKQLGSMQIEEAKTELVDRIKEILKAEISALEALT
jgi:hypothetical protein